MNCILQKYRQLRNCIQYQLWEVSVRKYFLSRTLENAGTLNFAPQAQNLLVPLRFHRSESVSCVKIFSYRYFPKRPVRRFAIAYIFADVGKSVLLGLCSYALWVWKLCPFTQTSYAESLAPGII